MISTLIGNFFTIIAWQDVSIKSILSPVSKFHCSSLGISSIGVGYSPVGLIFFLFVRLLLCRLSQDYP